MSGTYASPPDKATLFFTFRMYIHGARLKERSYKSTSGSRTELTGMTGTLASQPKGRMITLLFFHVHIRNWVERRVIQINMRPE